VRGAPIEENACATLSPTAEDTLLRLTDGRPAVLRLDYPGGGSVTLFADPGYFRNRLWRASDVPYFVTPLIVPARRGRVVWDEYHQGFGQGRSMTGVVMGWLGGTPGGWVVLQLAGVLVVGLAVAAVRFGPARRGVATRRRSPLEHLEALAAGLEGAAGADTAVALTVSGLRRRLGRTGLLRPDEQQSWLAALELALPTVRGRDAVRRLQQIITQPGGAERALAAAQAAGGAARSDAGAHRDRRRRELPALRDVHRVRHAKPDRVRGDVSASRGGARPVHGKGPGGLPRRDGRAGHPHPLRRGLRGG